MDISSYLKRKGVDFERIEHRPTYDSQRMAQALHVSGYHVAKTVLLRVGKHRQLKVAILPATHTVDFGRLRELLSTDVVELATELELARQCPDCEIGVLPPFGSLYGMETLVDHDVAEETFVVFEGTRHNEAIRMRFEDFRHLEQPRVLSFARAPVSA